MKKNELTYQLAMFISLSSVSRFASAHHDTEWKFVFHGTFCILDTWLNMQAWVQAFAIKTGLLARTITISVTSWFLNYWLWD